MVNASTYINLVDDASKRAQALESGKTLLIKSKDGEKKFNKFGESEHTIRTLASYLHKNLPKGSSTILDDLKIEGELSIVAKSPETFTKIKNFVESKKSSSPKRDTRYLKIHGGDYYGKSKNGSAKGPGILCTEENIWIATFENNDLKDGTVVTQLTKGGIIKQYKIFKSMKLETFNTKWKSHESNSPVNSGNLYYCDTNRDIELLAKVQRNKVQSYIAKAQNLYYKSNGNKVATLDSRGYKLTSKSNNKNKETKKAEEPKRVEEASPNIERAKFTFQREALNKSESQIIKYDSKELEAKFSVSGLDSGSEEIKLIPGSLSYKVSGKKYFFDVDSNGDLNTLMTVKRGSGAKTEEHTTKIDLDAKNVSNINLSKASGQEELNEILKSYTAKISKHLKSVDAQKFKLHAAKKKVNSSPDLIGKFLAKLEKLDLAKQEEKVSQAVDLMEGELLEVAENLISVYKPGSTDMRFFNTNIRPVNFNLREGCSLRGELYEAVLPGDYRIMVKRYTGVDGKAVPRLEKSAINGITIMSLNAEDSKPFINYQSYESTFHDAEHLRVLDKSSGGRNLCKNFTITCSKSGGYQEVKNPFILFRQHIEGQKSTGRYERADKNYVRADQYACTFEYKPKGEDSLLSTFKELITRGEVKAISMTLEVGYSQAKRTQDDPEKKILNTAESIIKAYPKLKKRLIRVLKQAVNKKYAQGEFKSALETVISQVEDDEL